MSSILLIFIVGIIAFIVFNRKSRGNELLRKRIFKRKAKSKRLAKGLIMGYGVLLMLATVLYFVLPNKQAVIEGGGQSSKEKMAAQGSEKLYNAASNGSFDQVKGFIKKGQWNFDYSGKKLTIKTNDYQNLILIRVKRKATNDHKIEITHYTTKTFVENVDLTDKMRSPTVSLKGDVLLLSKPARVDLTFTKFVPEFTITQFQEKSKANENTINYSGGMDVLYIRAPKDLEIKGKPSSIQYVGK